LAERLPYDPRQMLRSQRLPRPTKTAWPPAWSKVSFWLFLGGWLAASGLVALGFQTPERWRWMELIFPWLAALAALGALAQRVPTQNAVGVGFIVLVLTSGVVACDVTTGIPFGVIHYTERAEPLLFDRFPVWVPFWWVAILVSSRETARLILQPRRHHRAYGLWILGGAALLAVLTDLSWESYGVRVRSLWLWHTSERMVCWYSAPWVNFLGWAVVALVTLGFAMPWFINKHPRPAAPRLAPALVWALINLHYTIGNATRGLWLAAGVGLAAVGLVFGFAWHGAKHPAPLPVAPLPMKA